MKITWEKFAIVVLFAILIISNSKQCNNKTNISGVERDTISTVTTINTVVTTLYDTIRRDTTIYKENIKYNTIIINDTSSPVIKSTTSLNDSLLDIQVEAYSNSPVDSFKISYTPKFPITITKFITKETETVLEEQAKFKVFVGVSAMGSQNSFGFGPLAHFKARRDIIYTLGYDLVQREYQVGIAFKISFKRK